ncbi:MAG TPA: squalene/phytoene synthase family protein [Allosphingosinicella sp.]|jgi:phytoene synthase|nr:squalene/phytoene synthase family protein [Allosphingosinicella sp.]
MDLDPDRTLALSYVPAKRRAAVGALWRLDSALGAALAGGREPIISRIKLAWWREALEKLDREPAPPEPALQDLAEHVLPAGIAGAELAPMEEGWAMLSSPEALAPGELADYARLRGGLLFSCTARLLGERLEGIEPAGEAWALVDLARHCGSVEDSDVALAAARERRLPPRWPSRLRPLGMLAVLAQRDSDPARPPWEARGAPPRMWRMLRHRISGY